MFVVLYIEVLFYTLKVEKLQVNVELIFQIKKNVSNMNLKEITKVKILIESFLFENKQTNKQESADVSKSRRKRSTISINKTKKKY